MGALIPNPNDIEIINKLNTRFGMAGIAALRQFMANHHDDTFNAGRHLHRISYRLGIYPTTGARPRARWFVFLRSLIGATNAHMIQSAIRDAVNDWNPNTNPPTGCVGVKFWAIYDPTIAQDYSVDVYKAPPDAAGQYWATITLVCNHEIDPNEPGIPDPTTADGGESGGPPPTIGIGRRQPRAAKKAAIPKKSGKKTVKKSARRVGKRATKKASGGSAAQ